MATVLVVDDNKEQVTALRDALRAKGHTVETAMTGRLAIERGLRLRPDLILTEWILRDGPGGFRIAEALRAIRPETSVLILTRYPSLDVRQEAIDAGLFGYLTQPFDLAKIEAAIEKALVSPPRPVAERIALVEYDAATKIVFANAAALELLRLPADFGPDPRLSRMLGNRNMKQVETQRAEWVTITTLTPPPVTLEMLSMYAEGGRSRALILPAAEGKLKSSPIVRALVDGGSLALRSMAQKRLLPRALVIDPDRVQRRLLIKQLDSLGVPCHATESYDHALTVFEADPCIDLVILDYGTSATTLQETILRIQDVRAETKIVGMSVALRTREFEALGAIAFLTKPATHERLKELIAQVQGVELAAPVTAAAPPAPAAPTPGAKGPAVPARADRPPPGAALPPRGAREFGDPLVGKKRALSKELLDMPLGTTPIVPPPRKPRKQT